MLVKDIGTVEIGYAPRLGQFGFNKQNDAVEGIILMRTGEQAQMVLKRVEAKTKELNDHVLPKDVKVVPFYDRSDLDRAHDAHGRATISLRGIVLVVVVLIFFLYDIRSGLIVAVTIPLVAADRVHLSRPARHSGESAVDRRDRLRHSRRRRGGDGGEHLSPARATTRHRRIA